MSSTPFYLDLSPSTSINNFRASFKDGLGRENLFHFILKREPNIMFAGTVDINNPKQANINNLKQFENINTPQSGTKGYLDKKVESIIDNDPLSASIYQNAGNIYENINSRGVYDLTYRASKVSVPDKVLDTYTTYSYGPAWNFARALDSGSFAVTFINSSTYWEYNFMSRWQEMITNTDHTNASYNVCYYDDYISEANLICYDEETSPSYIFTFTDIYPISVGGLNMDWSSKDNLSEFTVVFNYRIMSSNKIALSSKLPSKALSTLVNLGSKFNNFGVQSPFKLP